MESTDNWLSMVKKLLKTSPLGATVGFGFIQVILEKLVEAEFSCPCHSSYNHGYGLVFFIAPSLIVFLLMCVISYSLKLWTCPWTWTWTCPWTWTCKSIWEALIIMLVPAVTWLIIVFVDGRYYACAKTNWNGKYELIENAAPQKWCKPSNSSLERDSLTDTQFWYSESQLIGFCTAAGLTFIYVGCFFCSRCCSSSPENRGNPVPLEEV